MSFSLLKSLASRAQPRCSPFLIARRNIMLKNPPQAIPFDGSELTFVKNPLEKLDVTDGGAYVIDLSASWCPPCRAVFPHLSQLQKQFPNVKMICVSDEPVGVFTKFAAKNDNMQFHVAVDNSGVLDAYRSTFRVQGIPHCFVIYKNQILFSGHPMDPSFNPLIAKIAAEAPAPVASSTTDSNLIDFSKLTKDEIKQMKISDLKEQLRLRHINFSDCFEKSDFLERVYYALGFKQ